MNAWQIAAELFRTVLIMSITGSVIALLLFVLKPLLKNLIPKAAQYYLWCLVLIALLIPFSSFIVVPVTTPMLPVQEMIEENIKTNTEWYEERSQEQFGMPFDELEAEKQIEVIYESNGWFNNWLLATPLTVGFTLLIISTIRYLVFSWKLRKKQLPAKNSEMFILKQLYKGKRPPNIYRNQYTSTPMLIGIFHPIIMLPDKEYFDTQLKNILLHELIHLRRHDIIIKWLSVLARHLHCFNPIVYLVCREIDRACELACDEAAIHNLDNDSKQNYGDTLIAVVAEKKTLNTVLTTTMCEEKKALKERLGAIMRSKKLTHTVLLFSCILFAMALCTTVLLGASAVSESVVDVLFREYRDENAVVRPSSVIDQIDLDNGSSLIFYYNAKRNIALAILEKGIFKYEIATTSTELTVDFGTPVSVMSSQYNGGDNWLAWGILRDSYITKAMFFGKEASIIETGDLRLCFMIGEGKIPDEYDFRFYNEVGNLVWDVGSKASAQELTVYIWKSKAGVNYALFDGYIKNKTETEIYAGERVYLNTDDLNRELSKYAIENVHLHIIQMEISDFSKEEMLSISDQIEIPADNYSSSIGAYSD